MISVTSSGDFNKTKSFLDKLLTGGIYAELERGGQAGVEALARATPVDTGLTATSWKYRIVKDRRGPTIEWYNTNTRNGTAVAVLIQYGHGTGTGGYIVGRDYINPAMRPVFDKIADDVWKKVKS